MVLKEEEEASAAGAAGFRVGATEVGGSRGGRVRVGRVSRSERSRGVTAEGAGWIKGGERRCG